MMDVPIMTPLSSRVLACKAAGMIVHCQRKILMVDRRVGTLGRACPAGHLDNGETAARCATRELFEETGLLLHLPMNCRPVLHVNVLGNGCGRGAEDHEWSVFRAELGPTAFPYVELREPTKHCGIGWFTPAELEGMEVEPVWRLFLQELRIIKR